MNRGNGTASYSLVLENWVLYPSPLTRSLLETLCRNRVRREGGPLTEEPTLLYRRIGEWVEHAVAMT